MINPNKNNFYIEIGPGFLQLTKPVSEKAKQVIAIEKDKRFEIFYKQITKPNITILFLDALDFDFKSLQVAEVYGNIPYYISSELIIKIASSENIKRAILLLQEEYAKRILSKKDSKDYGAITVLVDFFFNKKFIKTFPPNFFYPRPTINSSLIELTRKETYEGINVQNFLDFIRIAFGMRRKKLYNNLKRKFRKEFIKDVMINANIPLDARAENLSVDQYINLYSKIFDEK
jgi:16S rRNA (adenine1518-N6/adenine1519-N6)-dimethyltransferase